MYVVRVHIQQWVQGLSLQGLVSIDRELRQVTVRAGTTFHELNQLLDENGLAMSVLGSISDQTVAGAISTGRSTVRVWLCFDLTMCLTAVFENNLVCDTIMIGFVLTVLSIVYVFIIAIVFLASIVLYVYLLVDAVLCAQALMVMV